MHPDVSKNSEAHEQFVLLNEAYEYLINVGTTSSGNTKSSANRYQWTEQDWEQQQRENANERAREYARMRYQEFLKSDQYKQQQVVKTVTTHLSVVLSVILLLFFPILMYFFIGSEAIIAFFIVNLILLPVHTNAYRNLKNLNSAEFLSSLSKVFKIREVQVVALTIINFFLFFKIIIHTLVSVSFVLSAFLISILLLQLLYRNPKNRSFVSFGIGPTIVSILFLINYLFASNPISEKFHVISDGYRESSSLIRLENNQLDQYPGIRIFFDYLEVENANEVRYTFEYGLLGLMVMTDYQLIEN